MEQRLSLITLAADNLHALRDFYKDIFGWETEAANNDIVFFKLNGMLLGLYGREDLAKFNHSAPQGSGFRPFNLAYMVNSRQEVEDIYLDMKNKGVHIIQESAEPEIGGYYFLMTDPEGNVWEICYNLFIPIDENGHVIRHDSIDHL